MSAISNHNRMTADLPLCRPLPLAGVIRWRLPCKKPVVVITPKHDPDYLIHAGVYRDGRVIDAHGYTSAHDWAGMWRTKSMEFDGSFRRVNRAELMAMIPERGGDDEMAAAMPLARALVNAADVDTRAWKTPPPAGSFNHVMEAEPDEEIYANALSSPHRPVPHLAPSPSRAELQANAARMMSMQR